MMGWSKSVAATWSVALGVLLVGVLLFGAGVLAGADDDAPAATSDAAAAVTGEASAVTEKSNKSKSGNPAARPLEITPAREAAALTFVRQHHPELAELLIYLKESSPKEFERAVRDLFRTSERLAQTKERDAAAYDLELDLWKARSRVQLLGARIQMSDDESLRQQLRAALMDEYEFQVRMLQREREKVADRLKALDAQMERLTTRRDESIERQYRLLVATGRKPSGNGKSGGNAKPAGRKKSAGAASAAASAPARK